MFRSALGKVAWVGRTASMVFGLALVLALVFGAATTALSATGGNFILGKGNVATTPTNLVSTLADAAKSALIVQNKSGGAALDLRVGNAATPANDVAPMNVNSTKNVANLNADLLDGRDSGAFFTGRQIVEQSATARPNSQDYYSSTTVTATCPSGKSALGGGYYVGDVSDAVVVAHSRPTSDGTGWAIYVHNETAYDVSVKAYAICAVASN